MKFFLYSSVKILLALQINTKLFKYKFIFKVFFGFVEPHTACSFKNLLSSFFSISNPIENICFMFSIRTRFYAIRIASLFSGKKVLTKRGQDWVHCFLPACHFRQEVFRVGKATRG
jgi:hypothetical protein